MHAGQSKELLRYSTSRLVSLRWTKGHVEEDAAVGTQARTDARGNGAGDAAADTGRLMHESPPHWLSAMVDREVADVQAVVLHAARILPF